VVAAHRTLGASNGSTMNQQVTRIRWIIAAPLGLLVFSLVSYGVDSQGPTPTPGMQKFPDVIFDPLQIKVAYSGDVLLQNYMFGLGGKQVSRSKCERSDPSDPWTRLQASEGTSYFITGLSTREGGEQVFVAGLKDDATCVIERWTYSTRRQGWIASVPVPPGVGLGDPLPPTAVSVSVFGGGSWTSVPASMGPGQPASRSVIYTTSDGPLFGLSVDPEGRYLVTYDMGLKKLLQLDLTQDPVVAITLGQPSTQPSLDQVGVVDLMDFAGEGRKCLVRREYSADFQSAREIYTLFSDTDNDGVFESWSSLTQIQWLASPYSDWSKWDQFWR
jgi:hypothetical protein